MEKLTEKSSYEDLNAAWWKVENYTSSAMRPTEGKFNKNTRVIFRRVNTPEKIPALYLFAKERRDVRIMTLSMLLVEGSEGTTVVTKSLNDGSNESLFMLRSHAVNRYMQRHGFSGDYETCQEYLMSNLWINSQNVNKYTQELIIYFNGGVFLGNIKDKVYYVNTYVLNPHLYPNQRLVSRRLQNNIEEAFAEYERQHSTKH